MISTRNAYGDWLAENGENKDIVVVDADLSASTKTNQFAAKYPGRFFDVGAAEQNLIAFSSGLSLGGKRVFASSFSYFETARAWDQIRNLLAHDKLNVAMISSHGGLSCASDGPSHQALEELAIMRVLPNMQVILPCDAEETKNALDAIMKGHGPFYMRLRRENEHILEKNYDFKLGKAEVMREGSDVSMVTTGAMVYFTLQAAEALASQGVDAEVISVHTIKPFDEAAIIKSAKKTGAVLTVEQHQVAGGLGGLVAETLSESYPTLMNRMGVQDSFSETARTYNELLVHHKLTSPDITAAAQTLIEKAKFAAK
ncbi:transketolase family protein [Candidatus Bathyarchaeota archaeon]|jgi:transketolase|nr:transketolase family protein [Candidatus Bathyarchaeota archaeon]MBT4320242.1 transketolase family protein [Candidatus Bathyarchaeota archaeon]MBT4423411.1 transketolase family protein [Candidatus Bathyarchaeota archaeon]MBT7186258.1 transketolase family protein [Candidatus Bathyarchaeota archaeon]MBT7346605.1 transketolase family protein [Candidatus Bathyarchaeota archaeon]